MMADYHDRPIVVEMAAVLAALQAYRGAMGLGPSNGADIPIDLAELQTSISRVQNTRFPTTP